jgi:hypothetical protein
LVHFKKRIYQKEEKEVMVDIKYYLEMTKRINEAHMERLLRKSGQLNSLLIKRELHSIRLFVARGTEVPETEAEVLARRTIEGFEPVYGQTGICSIGHRASF